MRGLPTLPPSLPPSQFTDDVLSHLFLSTRYTPPSSSDSLTVHLLPNPSHLETVTPVALGFARGLQVPFGSLEAQNSGSSQPYELGSKVLSLSIHGDAAFGGQGVVAESLNLASLPHFTCGGTVHIVVNNQIGYTTPATQGRSSFYATDLAKMIAAPVLHVNGDKVDDVARAMKLALAYQQKFKKDVVIVRPLSVRPLRLELMVSPLAGPGRIPSSRPQVRAPGYSPDCLHSSGLICAANLTNRPSPHPSCTRRSRTCRTPSPSRTSSRPPHSDLIALLYSSVAQLYEQHLVAESTLSSSDAAAYRKSHFASLDEALAGADPEKFTPPELEMPRGWSEMRWPEEGEWETQVDTGFDEQALREIGERSVQVPDEIVRLALLRPSPMRPS